MLQQPDVKVLKNYIKVGVFSPPASEPLWLSSPFNDDSFLLQAFFQRAKL